MIASREVAFHENRRWAVARRAVSAFAALLTACGGGSGGTNEATPPVLEEPATAQIFPSTAGTVLAEYDETDRELQRSTATDAQGKATFRRTLRGTRVASVEVNSPLAVVTSFSARIDGTQRSVELTPITTQWDHLLTQGSNVSAAQVRLERLIGDACGNVAAREAVTGLYGHTPYSGDSREPVLLAFDAMTRGLNQAGLSPSVSGLDWALEFERHVSLLRRMCQLTSDARQASWLSKFSTQVAAADPKRRELNSALLISARQLALAQVLRLMASELPVLSQPELIPLLSTKQFSWRGTERELLLQLAQTQYLNDLENQSSTLAITGAPRELAVTLGQDGQIGNALMASATPLDDLPATLRLANITDEDRQVRVSINGMELTDMQGLVMQVLAVPMLRADEPLYERAWRYVILSSRHTAPITPGRMQHQADLYFRSVGRGYCDDVASVLKALWTRLGFESRVMALNGHVVPEVKVDGRWMLFDPDLAVYYLRRDRKIANVQDISLDPSLVTQPEVRLAHLDNWPYSETVAQTYADPTKIAVSDWLNEEPLAPLNHLFTVPRGGYIQFTKAADETVRTVIESEPTVQLSAIHLWLPPGYSGAIELPLILLSLDGDATIAIRGQGLETASGAATAAVQAYNQTDGDAAIQQIQIQHVGPSGLRLTLAANPRYFEGHKQLQVRMAGNKLEGLRFMNMARPL